MENVTEQNGFVIVYVFLGKNNFVMSEAIEQKDTYLHALQSSYISPINIMK